MTSIIKGYKVVYTQPRFTIKTFHKFNCETTISLYKRVYDFVQRKFHQSFQDGRVIINVIME